MCCCSGNQTCCQTMTALWDHFLQFASYFKMIVILSKVVQGILCEYQLKMNSTLLWCNKSFSIYLPSSWRGWTITGWVLIPDQPRLLLGINWWFLLGIVLLWWRCRSWQLIKECIYVQLNEAFGNLQRSLCLTNQWSRSKAFSMSIKTMRRSFLSSLV